MSARRIVRVGIVDTGMAADASLRVVAAQSFVPGADGRIVGVPAKSDSSGHGTHIARILSNRAPEALLLNAQVFSYGGATSPASVAAALGWLAEQRTDIVNLSLGLSHDRAILRNACEAALASGILLVAAAPARGPAVYPSSYPGVLRVTGDARCGIDEISHLASGQADFGAHPRGWNSGDNAGGASFAVAYVSAALVNYLATGGQPGAAYQHLADTAHYRGVEHRT